MIVSGKVIAEIILHYITVIPKTNKILSKNQKNGNTILRVIGGIQSEINPLRTKERKKV